MAGACSPRDSTWHITNPSFFRLPKAQLSTENWAEPSSLPQALRALCSVLHGRSLGQLQGQGRDTQGPQAVIRAENSEHFHTSVMAVMLLADLVMMYWPALLSGKKKNRVGKMFLCL